MKTMAAGDFKARCLALMDEVQAKREVILITKHGKPVAQLGPVQQDAADPIFGFMRGKGRIVADIVGPIVPLNDWDMLK